MVLPVEPARDDDEASPRLVSAREDDKAAPRRLSARPRGLSADSALIRVAQLDWRKPGNPLDPVENA